MAKSTPETTWLDVCVAFARAHEVPAELVEALDAFITPHPRGGPPPAPEPRFDADFDALEREVQPAFGVDGLTERLSGEIGGAQPGVFARRVAAVSEMLRALGTPAARVLRVGLLVRLQGILDAPPPRLPRVRALADYYYSLAARLKHPRWSENDQHLDDMVAAMQWRIVDRGVEHACLDGLADEMPVHVNLLRIDPRLVRITVEDFAPAARAGKNFAEAVGDRAAAAVSGGFFLYSEHDIEPPSAQHDPVGLLLSGGVVLNPPVFRRGGLLVREDGQAQISAVGLQDTAILLDGREVQVEAFWNRAQAEVGPDEETIAVVGDQVVAVGRCLAVPLNGFVARFEPGATAGIVPRMSVGYRSPTVGGEAATVGIAGGPTLVRAGLPVLDMRAEDFWGSAPPITFSQDETGDKNLLARMAIGLDDEGRLLVAAVDGRNAERALGMRLGDVSRLMILLGCHTAINLDGGSSKRMVVKGRLVDLPSTEIVAGEAAQIRVRPVHSALLFQPRA